jgi:alpha-glucosidase/alpha-D-xyloside xylohydrolase
MRALWLHYPHDAEAVKTGDEYLWGRDLLIAPVVEKGARSRRLYLPSNEWYDWWTNERTGGARWIERPVDLGTLPIYVRAGAIIPLDPIRQYTSESVNGPTTLRIFPGADGEFVLYDDDGISLDYQKNLGTWTRFRWNDHTRTLIIEPDSRSRLKPAGAREFEIILAGDSAVKSVTYSNRRLQTRL